MQSLIGKVVATEQDVDRLSKAMEDIFGERPGLRNGFSEAGLNDVLQLLATPEQWQMLAQIAQPYLQDYDKHLAELALDAGVISTISGIAAICRRVFKGKSDDKKQEEFEKLFLALNKAYRPGVQIGMGLPLPTGEGIDRNIVYRMQNAAFLEYVLASSALGLLAPKIQEELEKAKSEGYKDFFYTSAGVSVDPYPEAFFTCSGHPDPNKQKQVVISVDGEGNVSVEER